MDEQQNRLYEQILSGKNRQLQVMAAQGVVPLPPEVLIPLQVALTRSPDTQISGFAEETVATLETNVGVTYVNEHAGERELLYLGAHAQSHEIVEAVLRRPDVPRGVLIDLASVLPPELQEVLVHRQDAILEEPDILPALEQNPELSNYTKRRIWEYREHLLPKDKVPRKDPAEIEAESEAITDEELDEAIAEIRARAAAEGNGDASDEEAIAVDDERQLTDAEIRGLPVPMRMKLARNATKQVRLLLVRDTNAQVAVTVITGNSIPDSEVEQIANSRSVCDEVIRQIPKKREWIRKYSIARALVKNPKTPLDVATKLVPRMSVRDLRELAKDRNIPDAIRQMSLRLYQTKR
ncbi:MAG: hypothetical protein MPN21_13220 [Thermoanaerobaculia bacterium]|nr:hypothetical protein [Thermoanaerobaculia bacterium]